ncbi:MAG: DUF4154 domain-containing protein [Bacteroidales bacterium]|nr:DUF4154 domain-containing protein [Bacteroidales bacterium]
MKNTLKVIFFILSFSFSTVLKAQELDPDTKNDNFRAMWVFNIANNVIWESEDTITTYTIGVYSRSSNIFEELEVQSKAQQIKNKPVKVIYFNKTKSITPTNILYLGYDKNIDIFKVNKIIENKATLLITDRLDVNENFMVNILPFDKGSKRIEIDKMNIEAHDLSVTDQLLYHGGSEEELKNLYSQQKKQLDIQKEEVDKKKKEILELQKDVDVQKQQLADQKSELQKQKEKLFEMTTQLKQQELVLQNNDQLLARQENLIKSKQKDVQNKINELASKEETLKTKTDEIESKQEELKELENQIEDAKTDLTSANQKIESQKEMLIVGAIFVMVIFIFSLFLWQALRKNSKMNKELTKKNKEINKQKDRIEQQAKLLENTNKELEKLSIVAENAQNGVVIMDNIGDILWINAGYTKMYGYTLQLLINERDENITKASDNPEIVQFVNKCISEKTNVTYEIESTKRNGEKIWVKTTLTPIINEFEEIDKIVAIDTDITEIKKAEQKISKQAKDLEASNKELEKLSIVVSETDNAVLITDEKGNLEWVNQAFIDTFGFTLEEFKVNVSTNIISHTTQQNVKDKIELMYRTKKPVTYELLTHSKSGKEIWLQANVTPILDENNEIQKIVVVDADISAVKEAENEIREKNYELIAQKERIELQNLKINSSIEYAQTIQKAILPLKEITEKYFSSEIIFKPKDVVSGDFYWFFANEENNSWIAATVDCTGHGVPGAFMSLISSRILNDIVSNNKNIEPHELLEQTDTLIKKALRQDYTNNNDGLDIALCKVVKKNNNFQVLFAGAKRNLYFYSNKEKNILSLPGTRRSIGGVKKTQNKEFFKTSETELNKEDVLYLMTDGFIDQNNEKRKRFGSTKFVNIIEKVKHQEIFIQRIKLEEELKTHMTNTDQRDDITVWIIKL